MLNVTHNTTDYTIEAASRDELKNALISFGENASEINKMNKTERVEAVKVYRDRLQSAAFDAAEQIENARLAQLEIDKTNETFNAVKVAYLGCLTKKQDAAKLKITNVQAQIAEGEWFSVMATMKNYMEDMMVADQTVRTLNGVITYLTEQTTEPTHTLSQFMEFMEEDAECLMDRVLNSSEYQHRSTGVLRNLEGENEFKVMQEMAKFTRNAVKYMKKDLASGKTDPALMNCSHVYGW